MFQVFPEKKEAQVPLDTGIAPHDSGNYGSRLGSSSSEWPWPWGSQVPDINEYSVEYTYEFWSYPVSLEE